MQFALLSFFISKEESDLPSRTNEVVRCEERLLASCRGENTSLPSFLIHSFDEVGNKRLSAVASPSPTKNTSPKCVKASIHTQRLLVVAIKSSQGPLGALIVLGKMNNKTCQET